MKKNVYLVFVVSTFLCGVLQARVVPQGESLWKMQQLVTQASFDVTIRQSDLSAGTYTISQSGVYGLAENITGRILVNADRVVLDLNGKTIVNSSGVCVEINGRSQVTIRNGSVVSPTSNGILVSAGSDGITIERIIAYGCTVGLQATGGVTNLSVRACEFIGGDQGAYLSSVSRLLVTDSIASDSTIAGFFLSGTSNSLFTNCKALNTGQGLTDQTEDIYGFVSSNGSKNIFKNCVAQNTLALTVTGSSNKAAGFALAGTESNSQIVDCTIDVVQTSASGFATPYGILLDYSFDTLTTVTGGVVSLNTIAWAPNGAFFVVGGDSLNGNVQVISFDRATETITTLTVEHQGNSCERAMWSPDGAYLVTGGTTGSFNDEIQLFSFDSVAGILTRLDGKSQGNTCYDVDWSPDGVYLATGGESENGDHVQVFSFDRSTGLLTKLDGASQGDGCFAVAWSPDQSVLLTGGIGASGDTDIQVFSFDRSQGRLQLVGSGASQGGECRVISWSPDGAYVATGGLSQGGDEVQVFSFNRTTGALTKVTGANQGTKAFAAAWSPDGAYLATAGMPQDVPSYTVQLFSFDRSAGVLTRVDAQSQPVASAATEVNWSPDGAYLGVVKEAEGVLFSALQFPSNNMIINNNVQSVSRSSSIAGGVGISGSSIENMIVGNRAYNNAAFNYQFVTNVFDERFTAIPTLIENISFKLTPPFYAP